jgi:ribosomal protein S18 acetylase RimI-like enzyme
MATAGSGREDRRDVGRRGGGKFAGFIAGWIVEEDNIAAAADSPRVGYVSDICAMPPYRGRQIAVELRSAIERHLVGTGIRRVRRASLAANGSAQGAYRRAGFEPYDRLRETNW